jgi:hypothetical protein
MQRSNRTMTQKSILHLQEAASLEEVRSEVLEGDEEWLVLEVEVLLLVQLEAAKLQVQEQVQ